MDEFKQQRELIIKDLETLKVISDPLRRQILELTLVEPMTTKQIAEAVGAAPSKIYYHVRLLEKHGLIKVAETRLVANMVENLYQTAVENIRVDPSLLLSPASEGSQAFDQLIVDLFDEAKAQVRRSIQAGLIHLDTSAGERPRLANARFSNTMVKIRPEKVADFRNRLSGLLEEFSALDEQGAEDGEFYRLIVGFYPSLVASIEKSKDDKAESE
jgi:DNA-binding transcriptional ArsR family regulator